MMKIFLLIFSLMIPDASVGAQSVDWLVAPQYSEILYFGPQMYKVTKNGKVLWQGKESYSFEKRAKLKSFIRVHNNGANSNDRCLVTATIKNPSSVDVTTTVTLSGGGAKAHFANKSVKMTIPAYSTRSITSYFVVKNVELNGWCAVNITNGASAKRSGLQLKPF